MGHEDEDEDEDEDEGGSAAIEALSSIEHECPICESPLNVGKTKKEKKFYCMCSSGDCNLTLQNGLAQWANYILGIKFNEKSLNKSPIF